MSGPPQEWLLNGAQGIGGGAASVILYMILDRKRRPREVAHTLDERLNRMLDERLAERGLHERRKRI